jgi:isopenicillin-N epimerase
MEENPMKFFRELGPRLQEARAHLATFLGAAPEDLVFVPNATHGVNTVLQSLALKPGDELLTTDHAYNACRNALTFHAQRSGARVVTAPVPFPLTNAEAIVTAVLQAVTPRTRLALLDHVTSPTGLVFPIARLVAELGKQGIDTLVDGAHAPGMVPLNLESLGAAYYTGNLHKWVCAPKGAAFLHVRRIRQPGIHPLAQSHGMTSPLGPHSRFQLEFEWTGTDDFSPSLCVPEALKFLSSLLPGGLPALYEHNRRLVLSARRTLAERWNVALPCPDDMIGSLATLPLPPGRMGLELQAHLAIRHRMEVPVVAWPDASHLWVRISAHIYNEPAQYEQLAHAVQDAHLPEPFEQEPR